MTGGVRELPRIFISYRHDDSQSQAGRLYGDLQEHFGEHAVYRDIDSMKPGFDFVDRIERELASAAAVVVVIGNNWLAAADSQGRRRLDLRADYVRLEIGTALRNKTPIIPVLVGGAAMPGRDELPADLEGLARRQALELVERYWNWGILELCDVLEEIAGLPRQRVDDTGDAATGKTDLPAEDIEAAKQRFRTAEAVAEFLSRRGVDIDKYERNLARLLEIRNDEPLLEGAVAAKLNDVTGGKNDGLLVATPTRVICIWQGWSGMKELAYAYAYIAHAAIAESRQHRPLARDRRQLLLSIAPYSGKSATFWLHERNSVQQAWSILRVIHGRTEDGVVDLSNAPRA